MFQSPLHWGIAFNLPLNILHYQRGRFQSPLHWGIAFNPHGVEDRKAMAGVSVPSSLGHRVQQDSSNRLLNCPTLFQSPLHWGIAFNSCQGCTGERRQRRFSPLFIGASRSTTYTCTILTASL